MKPVTTILLVLSTTLTIAGQGHSKWVHLDAQQKLRYATDPRGNRIMDFSHAGYGGGGVALPVVPAVRRVSAAAGDNTTQIQAALDEVSRRPIGADGFRGAVLLQPGTYEVSGTLRIAASGVVLRGSGSGDTGTTIRVSGPPHRFLDLTGTGTWQPDGAPAAIVDAYVPSGTSDIRVDGAARFKPGDRVLIRRPVTDAWIRFMNMDKLSRDGKPQVWIAAGTTIDADRTIASIAGDRVTLDVPLSDSIDASHSSPPGGKLSKYSWPGRISNVGLEGVRILAPPQGDSLSDPKFQFFTMDAVVDAWVKDVYYRDCVDCSSVSRGAKRVTIEDVTVQHTGGVSGAPYPTDWSLNGTQILAHRFRSLNARNVYTVIAQGSVTGPIVALNYESTQQKGVEPHQRWATGMLFDNINVDGDMSLMNRGYYGSGHGWTVGWAVAWNTVADRYIVQRPQGTMNWSIGGSGTIHDQPRPGRSSPNEPRGTFESHGTRVSPSSLYLAQLCTRLGPQALANIGY